MTSRNHRDQALSQSKRAMFLVAFIRELLQHLTHERNFTVAERNPAVRRCKEIETNLNLAQRDLQVVPGLNRRAVAVREQNGFLLAMWSMSVSDRGTVSLDFAFTGPNFASTTNHWRPQGDRRRYRLLSSRIGELTKSQMTKKRNLKKQRPTETTSYCTSY